MRNPLVDKCNAETLKAIKERVAARLRHPRFTGKSGKVGMIYDFKGISFEVPFAENVEKCYTSALIASIEL